MEKDIEVLDKNSKSLEEHFGQISEFLDVRTGAALTLIFKNPGKTQQKKIKFMSPKLDEKKIGTRTTTKNAGVSFSWNKKLGDKTIVESGPLDAEEERLNSEARNLEAVEIIEAAGGEDHDANGVHVADIETEVSDTERTTSEEETNDNLNWDHVADSDSPLKDEHELLDISIGSFQDCDSIPPCVDPTRTWSTSVNRLDRLDPDDITPERRPRRDRLDAELGTAGPSQSQEDLAGLPAVQEESEPNSETGQSEDDYEDAFQDEDLENDVDVLIVVPNDPIGRAEVERLQDRLDLFVELPVAETDREIEAEPDQVEGNMDEPTFRTRSRTFDDQLRLVEDAIGDFTVDDVIEVDGDRYKEALNEAKEKFTAFRTGLRNFYAEFDRTAHPDWEQEWEHKLKNLREKHQQNDRNVRNKVAQIKEEKAKLENETRQATAALSTQQQAEKEEKVVRAKAEIDRIDILAKLVDLQSKIKKVGKLDSLDDFEGIKFLTESHTWNIYMSEISKKDIE